MHAMPQTMGALHFIGIGGIGMSGIAEVLHNLGYQVQGSDLGAGANVKRLQKLGVRVVKGHDPENIRDSEGLLPAVVVYSSAVKNDNAELREARASRVPVIRRADMLAELMRLKKCVAIAGTHGKTTTTSFVGAVLDAANFDPTVINGGIVDAYGTNARLGASEWMVVEADESDGSFTRLPATVGVITNIDPEHLDHYGDYDAVKEAFRVFVENLPFYGFAVLCADHPAVQAMIPKVMDRKLVTYGTNPQADVQAVNIRPDGIGTLFDVEFSEILDRPLDTMTDVRVPMPGQHNVLNALAALSVAAEMDLDMTDARRGLENFTGVKRRFTCTGESNGITVIDDYGHHPVEITAVLKAARQVVQSNGKDGRVIAVMQPHRYTRLQSLFEEFCTCFNDADIAIIADVYEAGEQPIEGADKDGLVDGIRRHGHREVYPLPSPDKLSELVGSVAREGDLVICLGAGNITQWAYDLPEALDAILERKVS